MDSYAMIALSRTFITILPSEGYEHPSNAEGARQLRWAIHLGKPVVVWRFPERRRLALPTYLSRHHDLVVIDGGRQKFARELMAWMDRRGFKPADLEGFDYWPYGR